MADLPTISIITPSFNQAAYLEDTIRSVLGQQYENLEYIVLDANSTDGSVEIIRKYESKLAYWHSKPDGGQAAAINAGFRMAKGQILGWLNSDDMYLPGTLHHIASKLSCDQPMMISGNCVHIRQNESDIRGSDIIRHAARLNLRLYDYIVQPSTFWTRSAFEKVGPLDESLCYTLDWDWFIRATDAGVPMLMDQRYLSIYRLHEAHKSGTTSPRRLDEIQKIYAKYAGPQYARAFCKYRTMRAFDQRIHKNLAKYRLSRIWNITRRLLLQPAAGALSWNEFSQISSMA